MHDPVIWVFAALAVMAFIAGKLARSLFRRLKKPAETDFEGFSLTTTAALLIPLDKSRSTLSIGSATLHDHCTLSEIKALQRSLPGKPAVLIPFADLAGAQMTNDRIWIEGLYYPLGKFVRIRNMWYEFPDMNSAILFKLRHRPGQADSP